MSCSGTRLKYGWQYMSNTTALVIHTGCSTCQQLLSHSIRVSFLGLLEISNTSEHELVLIQRCMPNTESRFSALFIFTSCKAMSTCLLTCIAIINCLRRLIYKKKWIILISGSGEYSSILGWPNCLGTLVRELQEALGRANLLIS